MLKYSYFLLVALFIVLTVNFPVLSLFKIGSKKENKKFDDCDDIHFPKEHKIVPIVVFNGVNES